MGAREALNELYGAISDLQTVQPDTFFIVVREFSLSLGNHANLKSALLKYCQHIDFAAQRAHTSMTAHTKLSFGPILAARTTSLVNVNSSSLTVWYGTCTISDRRTLQRILRTAEKIIGMSLPTIDTFCHNCCICKAASIVDDPSHSSHERFTLPEYPFHYHQSLLLP